MTHPADWYPDPHGAPGLRYWDGRRWTDHYAPSQADQAQPGTPTAPLAPVTVTVRHESAKVPVFGARNLAKQQADELQSLRAELKRLGALDVVELQQQRDALTLDVTALSEEIAVLRRDVVLTKDEQILQEVGVYQYQHPLGDSVAYKAELARLQDRIKAAVKKGGGAIQATTSWQVNGSAAEGRKMVNDFSKLMLRAYNAEADNLVRGLKPYRLQAARDRLEKVAFTIEKLGKTMLIRVAPPYHQLRIRELELTADYLEKLAEEKEREREERERLREERQAQLEMERERKRLEKEQQHYLNALAALEAKGDAEAIARMRERLAEVGKAIEDVDYRVANARAGYVYVISNLGSFGEGMIKVGMTRRLDPRDRVRELSDASVPFNFDVHALFFANDAVGIEAQMHQRLAAKRVNKVNLRREFFYATPAETRELLAELAGDLLTFEEMPEAVEYHQSQHTAD